MGFPPWVLTLIQMALPAAFAIIVMYVKIGVLEKAVDSQHEEVVKLRDKASTQEAALALGKSDSNANQREVLAAIKRVEDDVRELKVDLKDMRNKAAAGVK
jgi:F0F1-type ATP synthase membrane subunit b/b'